MVYTFAALINENEYFILSPSFRIIHYDTLHEAKKLFQSAYDTMKNPSPTSTELSDQMENILQTQPCILQFDVPDHELRRIILSWSRNRPSLTSNIPIVPVPHVLIPMRSGFIKQYQALNILQDIETTVYIGKNGNIGYHRFNLRK